MLLQGSQQGANVGARQEEDAIGSGARAKEDVFWSIVHVYAGVPRTPPRISRTADRKGAVQDREDAELALRLILRLPLSVAGIRDLLHCCWLYSFALTQRESLKRARYADAEKEARRELRQLATDATGLARSISAVLKDPIASGLLLSSSAITDPRFPGLRAALLDFAAAVKEPVASRTDAGGVDTQAKIVVDLRRSAMLGNPKLNMGGMVPLAIKSAITEGPRGKPEVSWELLALLVHLFRQRHAGHAQVRKLTGTEVYRDYIRMLPH